MPAVAIAAPEIAFVAILFACFMLYALAFYMRNTTSNIIIVGGALAAAFDWILDRIGELIVFFIQVAANFILAFVSFWNSFVSAIISPIINYIAGILADFNYWIEWLKSTIGPAALAAQTAAAQALALAQQTAATVAGSVNALIVDLQNTVVAIKNQLLADEAQLAVTAATVAAVVGTGVLAIPMTLPQLIARVQEDERIIAQQAATIASQSATLVQNGQLLTDLQRRVGLAETEIGSIITIGAVTALGAEAVQTVARLAKNPCLCFLPDMEMGWMVPVVVGLATDTL